MSLLRPAPATDKVPANIRDWVQDAAHEVRVTLERAEAAEVEVSRLRGLLDEAQEAIEGQLRDMHTGSPSSRGSEGADGLGCARRCTTCDLSRSTLARLRAEAGQQRCVECDGTGWQHDYDGDGEWDAGASSLPWARTRPCPVCQPAGQKEEAERG